MSSKRHTAFQILMRAEELGIQVTLAGEHIRLEADEGVITPKILQVFADHKQELIEALTPLCSPCLNTGRERKASFEDSEGIMYCEEHHPTDQTGQLPQQEDAGAGSHALSRGKIINLFVQQITELTGGCAVAIDPPGYTIADRARQLRKERQARAEKLPHTEEELALIERLRPGCNMQLVQTPCPKCACRIERTLFGMWECANCEPYAGWSEQTLERIRATALYVQSCLDGRDQPH